VNRGDPESRQIGSKAPANHFIARRAEWVAGFVCLLLLLAGCQADETEFYRPPTLAASVHSPTVPAATATHTPQPALITPIATAAPPCTDNLTFQEDLTIPDGTLVSAGESWDKQWQVLNSGTCNWDAGYRLELLSGPALGTNSAQALYPARSGSEAVIRILFTAPAEAGVYQSAWQAVDPAGNHFGDPIYIQIVVQANP
jgi:hypothetical protein